MNSGFSRYAHMVMLFCAITTLAFFFAMTEIQIEGPHGWAGKLPTWKIESHPLLDLFWGGRPMTGYHAWVFAFMLLAFHLPHVMHGRVTFLLEVRSIGSIMFFWIMEDMFWFFMNPAFGLSRLRPEYVPWHKHWFLGVPADYVTFGLAGIVLILVSFYRTGRTELLSPTWDPKF